MTAADKWREVDENFREYVLAGLDEDTACRIVSDGVRNAATIAAAVLREAAAAHDALLAEEALGVLLPNDYTQRLARRMNRGKR